MPGIAAAAFRLRHEVGLAYAPTAGISRRRSDFAVSYVSKVAGIADVFGGRRLACTPT